MEHLKLIEFEQTYASNPELKTNHVAIFDDRHVSAEEVYHCIEAGEESPNIVYMTREQYIRVFARSFQETFCLPEQSNEPDVSEVIDEVESADICEEG